MAKVFDDILVTINVDAGKNPLGLLLKEFLQKIEKRLDEEIDKIKASGKNFFNVAVSFDFSEELKKYEHPSNFDDIKFFLFNKILSVLHEIYVKGLCCQYYGFYNEGNVVKVRLANSYDVWLLKEEPFLLYSDQEWMKITEGPIMDLFAEWQNEWHKIENLRKCKQPLDENQQLILQIMEFISGPVNKSEGVMFELLAMHEKLFGDGSETTQVMKNFRDKFPACQRPLPKEAEVASPVPVTSKVTKLLPMYFALSEEEQNLFARIILDTDFEIDLKRAAFIKQKQLQIYDGFLSGIERDIASDRVKLRFLFDRLFDKSKLSPVNVLQEEVELEKMQKVVRTFVEQNGAIEISSSENDKSSEAISFTPPEESKSE